jgi:hypothetical protein
MIYHRTATEGGMSRITAETSPCTVAWTGDVVSAGGSALISVVPNAPGLLTDLSAGDQR